jgi:hypothetical protein
MKRRISQFLAMLLDDHPWTPGPAQRLELEPTKNASRPAFEKSSSLFPKG